MIDLLVFFIGASLLLYVLLGGSLSGAGILELLPAGRLRAAQKKVINQAMGPIWEANHMWLILVVVILFMGFPTIFTTLMISLHIPMLALLVGIVVRGSAFAFRHYDMIQEEKSQRGLYLAVRALQPVGGLLARDHRGQPQTWGDQADPSWPAAKIGLPGSLLGAGSDHLAVGAFVTCIYAFLAGIYLVARRTSRGIETPLSVRLAARFNGFAVLTGGLAAFRRLHEGAPVSAGGLPAIPAQPRALVALATLLFVALWFFIAKRRTMLTRVVASGQVALILLGWYAPFTRRTRWLLAHGAVEVSTTRPRRSATLRQLVLALLVGSLFIFPSLFHLFRVFKLPGGLDSS